MTTEQNLTWLAREIDVINGARTLAILAHNLKVAAFGALMFRAGDNFGFHMGEDQSQCMCQWSPGHGVPYEGATRCEIEVDDDCVRDDSTDCSCPRCTAAEDRFWDEQGPQHLEDRLIGEDLDRGESDYEDRP